MSKLPRLLPLIAIAIGGVVAVRAVGVAPGLFQGAVAWAEEAPVAEGAPTPKPVPAVCALSPEQLADQAGISPAELRVIQSLKDRRGELDIRDNDFATMLPLMAAAEQKLDARIQALDAIRTEVQGLLGQVDEKEKAEIDRLVAVYSAMRPKEAAAVFVSLNDDVRLPVAAAMRPRTLAAIMAQMPAPAARDLTERLARRFQAQQLAARAAVAAADTTTTAQPAATAPAPTQASTAPAATNPPRPRPAANRPAPNRPAASRPAAQPPRPPAGSAAATAQGAQPYQATGGAPTQPPGAQPRQSVQ